VILVIGVYASVLCFVALIYIGA